MIPVHIFNRACNFYNVLLDTNLKTLVDNKWNDIAVFWNEDASIICGCISDDNNYQPSDKWTVIYLNTFWKIDDILNRIIPAWGKIRMPRTSIWEYWYIAHFEDSEWNIIWLHQQK